MLLVLYFKVTILITFWALVESMNFPDIHIWTLWHEGDKLSVDIVSFYEQKSIVDTRMTGTETWTVVVLAFNCLGQNGGKEKFFGQKHKNMHKVHKN